MAAASGGTHEPLDKLKPQTVDIHRAIVSLMEELEAIDWYRQRVDAASDDHLRAILEHNMNEEIEHATMVLEWLRRNIPTFDKTLRTYLFTTGDVTQIESSAASGEIPEKGTRQGKSRTTIGDMKES
jgi:ferritin-like protein